jgi:hypothetical protein
MYKYIICALAMMCLVVPNAMARTWKAGQTARYTVSVDKGPKYRVSFTVPKNIVVTSSASSFFGQRSLYLGVSSSPESGKMCGSFATAAQHLDARRFGRALRAVPFDAEKHVRVGRGNGKVRWTQFLESTSTNAETGQQEREYAFYALHPSLKKKGLFGNEFYGVSFTNLCMGTAAAKRLVNTVKITPLQR